AGTRSGRPCSAQQDPPVGRMPSGPNYISVDLLERLLADPEPKVADHAAANPVLPRARMERIIAEAGRSRSRWSR
ncbi:hypothetical protein ACLQ18_43995, partial [Streptomyces sp. DT193]